MSQSFPLVSASTRARPNTKSLRCTIPEGVVAFLGLEDGSKLNWFMEESRGRRYIELFKQQKIVKQIPKKRKIPLRMNDRRTD